MINYSAQEMMSMLLMMSMLMMMMMMMKFLSLSSNKTCKFCKMLVLYKTLDAEKGKVNPLLSDNVFLTI